MLGRHTVARLDARDQEATLQETDLMEWNDGPAQSMTGPVNLPLKPFEICTYKLHRKDF
jgi:hypothetical protein